jgi:pantoate--beta-alanine ligase
LIQAARKETQFVVVTIFVNPTQFGPNEDFANYPRPLADDLNVCRREQVDLVFAPPPETVYAPDFQTWVEVQRLQDVLCGPSRPGHFRGVATIVLKLFHIVQPDIAYFGQKDYQQARIIQRMVSDLNLPVQLRICPIVREPDGLALSSRNRYLDPNQRKHATVLHRALQEARRLIESGERRAAVVQRVMESRVGEAPGAVLDYAAIVDAASLRPVDPLQSRVLIALAVRFGTTRLIDNEIIEL